MKWLAARLSLILFGATAAIVIAEAALRLLPNTIGYIDNGLIRIPWFAAEHDFDEDIGFWPKPNQHFRRTSECYDVEQVHFNSLGMRSDWSPGATRKKHRIAVLGDSMMQALQVKDDEHFSALLQQRVPDSEVLNFGVSSTGSIQQLQIYRKKIASLKPDLVVQALFLGNDIFDNSAVLEGCYTQQEAAAVRPFYAADGTITKPSKTVPRRYYEEASSFRQRVHNFLTNYSFVYNAILQLRAQGALNAVDTPIPCPNWPYTKEIVPAGALIPPPDTYWEQAWHDTIQAILELRSEVEKNGGVYHLLIIPDMPRNLETYKKLIDAKYPEIKNENRNFRSDYGVGILEKAAVENKIYHTTIGLADDLTFSCDAHFNPHGHAVAVETLLRDLRKNPEESRLIGN